MRSLCCFLLALTVFLLVNCGAALDATQANGAESTQLTTDDDTASVRFLSTGQVDRRFLRSDGKAEDGEESEERGLVPSQAKAALGKLKTKDAAAAAQSANKLNKEQISFVQKVKRWFRSIKSNLDFYFRTAFWETRFTVWAVNKRTPAMMYDKLGVRYTSGIGDKNYRTYVNYLRFYEHFKGPAENPLIKYGPKVDVNYKVATR
jgi:hypothetical protein